MAEPKNENSPIYEHDATCTPADLVPSAHPDILTCTECQGMFDKITKKPLFLFDERLV